MNAREANVLLVKLNYRDEYPRWRTPQDLAAAATEWADDLADVPLEVAIVAMREHYAAERRPMMITDVIAAVPPTRGVSEAGNVTEQRLARREVTS